jgi:hypothetical protein
MRFTTLSQGDIIYLSPVYNAELYLGFLPKRLFEDFRNKPAGLFPLDVG